MASSTLTSGLEGRLIGRSPAYLNNDNSREFAKVISDNVDPPLPIHGYASELKARSLPKVEYVPPSTRCCGIDIPRCDVTGYRIIPPWWEP